MKAKSKGFIQDVSIIASDIKDGFAGKTPKALELVDENIAVVPSTRVSRFDTKQKTVRFKEEPEQIVGVIRSSAATLAACIRMLNNPVMADDGVDPQLRIVIQEKSTRIIYK